MAAAVSLTFPDGSVKKFDAGTSGRDVAESISKSLAKKAVAVAIDGDLRDLADPVSDGAVEIVTRDDPRALELIRHDAAHVMAEAVQELWPGTQVTIGPVIENGFYYDFKRVDPDARGLAVHAGRPAGDRKEDARDHPAQRAFHQGNLDPPEGQARSPIRARPTRSN
jgi:hypothetical protein